MNDPAHSSLATEQIVALAPVGQDLLFVADKRAVTEVRHAGAGYLTGGGGERPRVMPNSVCAVEQLVAIENNVSMANRNWAEFVDAAENDGVLHGL
ncbi:hypothetical protein AB0N88_15960 [Streptomyces sp. NPDC093516]|uniref:DUF6924 domain-containing protein n=1 Tax=Streptomyces sp. NPDC093516 TaxID=3155304 RepID=UPI003418B23B